MIKKDYFPTQRTPDWVKLDVMSKIGAGQKKLRLMYIVNYKILAPVVMFLVVISGSYIYLNHEQNFLLSDRPIDLYTAQTSQIIEVLTNTDTLQKKLNELEITLDSLSESLDQETDIVF